MKKLENRAAIITGGAGSIGKATAQLFLEAGTKVILADLVGGLLYANMHSAKSAAGEIRGQIIKK